MAVLWLPFARDLGIHPNVLYKWRGQFEADTEPSPYGGWLSFNNEGCPPGYIDCRARVGGSPTDPIRPVLGFAKFVGDGAGRGLNQWVSLSKKSGELASCTPSATNPCDYGLYYSTTNQGTATIGTLRGFAWGSGPGSGWITFGGPILKNVVQSSLDPSEFTLTYDNPITYKSIRIFVAKENEPFVEQDIVGSAPSARGADNRATVRIDNVEANKNYRFKVRGEL